MVKHPTFMVVIGAFAGGLYALIEVVGSLSVKAPVWLAKLKFHLSLSSLLIVSISVFAFFISCLINAKMLIYTFAIHTKAKPAIKYPRQPCCSKVNFVINKKAIVT